ncbi:DNA-directed RNA polymerase subunit alpha [Trichonephila clavipes]|nr:DNA-directed RNA polymerase subunit alpha [Trichonephila clavipes]
MSLISERSGENDSQGSICILPSTLADACSLQSGVILLLKSIRCSAKEGDCTGHGISSTYHSSLFTNQWSPDIYAITTQGLNAIDIWDFFLQIFDIPIAEPIPKYKEPLIFPKVNIPPRDQEFWRMTVHQKLYYTDLFYYFDAHDIRKQSFANFVTDYVRHYFPKDPKGVHKGHFVKLFMPSSYHAQAIGNALPYPLQFERDNVILLSLKLTSQHEKEKLSNKLKLLIEPSFHAEIVEVEIGGIALYRPFREFRQANSYCHLYGAQVQRQAYF